MITQLKNVVVCVHTSSTCYICLKKQFSTIPSAFRVPTYDIMYMHYTWLHFFLSFSFPPFPHSLSSLESRVTNVCTPSLPLFQSLLSHSLLLYFILFSPSCRFLVLACCFYSHKTLKCLYFDFLSVYLFYSSLVSGIV